MNTIKTPETGDFYSSRIIEFPVSKDNTIHKSFSDAKIKIDNRSVKLRNAMPSSSGITYSDLYNSDFAVWVEKTAGLLKERNLQDLDIDNLIEEVEDLSKRERHDLRNRLRVLLAHLLKWQYQPSYRSYPETKNNWNENSWARTIIEQRDSIKDILSDSPSLYNFLLEVREECYQKSRKYASKETHLEVSAFPEFCPYSDQEILNDEFWPD